jgi:hypothetical protein
MVRSVAVRLLTLENVMTAKCMISLLLTAGAFVLQPAVAAAQAGVGSPLWSADTGG